MQHLLQGVVTPEAGSGKDDYEAPQMARYQQPQAKHQLPASESPQEQVSPTDQASLTPLDLNPA